LKLAAEFISGRKAVLEKISGESVPESGMLPEGSEGAALVGARQRGKPAAEKPHLKFSGDVESLIGLIADLGKMLPHPLHPGLPRPSMEAGRLSKPESNRPANSPGKIVGSDLCISLVVGQEVLDEEPRVRWRWRGTLRFT
jgi:hypothetical protein